MPDPLTPALAAAYSVEIALFLAGLFVWWHTVLRPSARVLPPRLAPWTVSLSDFLVCALAVIGGGYFSQILGRAIGEPFLRKFSATNDTRTVIYGAAFQFGLLAGVAGAQLYLCAQRKSTEVLPPRRTAPSLLIAGGLTFLAVLPAVDLTSLAWGKIIEYLGLPQEPQDLVGLFANGHSRWFVAVLFILATIVAPVVEELVFRAGLFRYLRTRIPRWAALLLPALFFAALHGNWASLGPIAALAIVFSLAYERTGRIGVTMIAHSLFNLNTILLILAGVRT
jgi:membrane protease YdiL (CAAX protease family)